MTNKELAAAQQADLKRVHRKALLQAAKRAGIEEHAMRPNRIAELLNAKGMSVIALAAAAEISYSVMADMAAKRYDSDVSLTRARRIANAMGETVDAVFPPVLCRGRDGEPVALPVQKKRRAA